MAYLLVGCMSEMDEHNVYLQLTMRFKQRPDVGCVTQDDYPWLLR
jgi:hypothetical protein